MKTFRVTFYGNINGTDLPHNRQISEVTVIDNAALHYSIYKALAAQGYLVDQLNTITDVTKP